MGLKDGLIVALKKSEQGLSDGLTGEFVVSVGRLVMAGWTCGLLPGWQVALLPSASLNFIALLFFSPTRVPSDWA